MYQNASVLLEDKSKLSDYQRRNALSLAKVENNVRKIKSMVHLFPVMNQDDIIVPKNIHNADMESEAVRNEQQKMKLRLRQSAALVPYEARIRARPNGLDKEFIEQHIQRVDRILEVKAEDESNNNKGKNYDHESSQASAGHGHGHGRRNNNANSKEKGSTLAAQEILENKLAQAIKDEYKTSSIINSALTKAAVNDDLPRKIMNTKKNLTTRFLLPFYKLDDVKKFVDIFATVDDDFSGDLDSNEWVRLFASLNKTITPQEARMIFLKIDKNNDGKIKYPLCIF